MDFEILSNKVLGMAIEVHKNLGPGLLESTYKQCFAYELSQANEYYTDAILLTYSYKGRLLNKQVIPIDRNIFLEQ